MEKEQSESMLMRVYVRGEMQSFHLENGINRAHHMISALVAGLDAVALQSVWGRLRRQLLFYALDSFLLYP